MGLERAEIGTKKGTNQGQEGQSSGRRRARGLTAFPEAPVAGQQGLRQGLSCVIPCFIIIRGHPRQGVLHSLPGVQQLLSHLLTCKHNFAQTGSLLGDTVSNSITDKGAHAEQLHPVAHDYQCSAVWTCLLPV